MVGKVVGLVTFDPCMLALGVMILIATYLFSKNHDLKQRVKLLEHVLYWASRERRPSDDD